MMHVIDPARNQHVALSLFADGIEITDAGKAALSAPTRRDGTSSEGKRQ